MEIEMDAYIRERVEKSTRAAKQYEKYINEAQEKYSQLNLADLSNHKCRLERELLFFGPSFKVHAGLQVIKNLIEERAA